MPAGGSRPASDTDDAMWEELLQGPDSASSESSDSEGNGRYAGMTLPQTTSLSTDDESLQQDFTGVRQLTSDLDQERKNDSSDVEMYNFLQSDLNLG